MTAHVNSISLLACLGLTACRVGYKSKQPTLGIVGLRAYSLKFNDNPIASCSSNKLAPGAKREDAWGLLWLETLGPCC
jgi:hypothetical protein